MVAPIVSRAGTFDAELLATYCQVWSRWREAESTIAKTGQLIKTKGGGVAANPMIAIANQASAQVRALEQRLGIPTAEREEEDAKEARASARGSSRLMTRWELAALFGHHRQTVTKWERDGLPVAVRGRKGKPSKYRERDVRAWLQQREEAAKQPGSVFDVAKEKAGLAREQADLTRQTRLARARDLLPRDEVERIWTAEIAAVRAKLLAWPMTLADQVHRVAVLEGLPGVERVLQEAVRQVLRELAEPTLKTRGTRAAIAAPALDSAPAEASA
jgi:P27 family predicted phage terminase small subunit